MSKRNRELPWADDIVAWLDKFEAWHLMSETGMTDGEYGSEWRSNVIGELVVELTDDLSGSEWEAFAKRLRSDKMDDFLLAFWLHVREQTLEDDNG